MNKPTALLPVAVMLSACAAAPERNTVLEEARSAYSTALNTPQVVQHAPTALNKARDQLATAERLSREQADPAAVTHHAYLSKTNTAIAVETAKLRAAEQTVKNASAERESLVLQARAREAQTDALRAQLAREIAEAKARAAEEARQQSATQAKAAEAERLAAEAERLAAIDQARDAELAQQRAQEAARLREIELAQQQAAAKQKLEVLMAELQARETERGLVLTLGNILFDVDGHDLKPGAAPTLDKLAGFLKEYSDRTVLIEGFTDSTGSETYNKNLSDQRAHAVKQALMSRGIEEKRISTQGFGEARPVASNQTPAGRQQNRRVEVVIPDTGVSGPRAK
jgi:outer membrane protein OmpA-like peptidoglycan-associated protein